MKVVSSAIVAAILVLLPTCAPLTHAQVLPTGKDVRVGADQASVPRPGSAYRKLHALVVGINRYASGGIPPLAYAENDAREVARILKDLYGFDNVTLLVGADATRDRIVEALANLQDRSLVSPDDGVVIYFSGHGQTIPTASGEQGYLLPVDAVVNLGDIHNAAPFRRYAIRMDDLRSDADAIQARHVLFLVDACYSGYLSSKALEESPEIVNALRYPARQVITAGTKGERAVEHNAWGHGAFTYKLLERLRIETEPVSATALGSWLKKAVPREVAARAPQYSLTPQAKYLSGDGDFYFIRTGYALDLAKLQKAREPITLPAPSAEYYRRIFEAERLLNELERESTGRR